MNLNKKECSFIKEAINAYWEHVRNITHEDNKKEKELSESIIKKINVL